MRILCNILVVLFVTATAVGQQINPVPDYIFRNSMSVGRNAPTDTSAYFSIGPRFGATKGFMPPMVVDTAAVTGTKRNGLLIYSIQRNSFLYWDSTGSRWSRIAANLDTLLLSTRAWRQKGDDSLAALIGARIGGSGTINRHPKFTASGTIGDGSIADSSTSVRMTILSGGNIGVATAAPAYNFDVAGSLRNTTNAFFNTTSGESYFGTTTDAGSFRVQVSGNQLISNNNPILNITDNDGTVVRSSILLGTIGGAWTIQNDNDLVIKNVDPDSSISTGSYMILGRTTGDLRLGTNALERMRITSGGNVGVGITPTSKLHVSGASPSTVFDGQFTIQNTETSGAANTGAAITFVVNDGAANRTISAIRAMKENSSVGDYGSYLTFYTRVNGGSNEERLRVTSTGLIGINTTSPSERLHVVGRARVTTIDSSASPINMLWADNNGVIRKTAVPTASVSGGTTDFIPLWSSSTALTSSVIKQVSSEILVGYTTDQGTFKLQVDGNTFTNGSIKTAAPSGGTAAEWKLGIVVAGSYTAASNYLQVDVGGTLYYIGLVTPN
jgi:hypothetical protein